MKLEELEQGPTQPTGKDLPIAQLEPAADSEAVGKPEYPVIGIGASAGGLAAFEQLFTHLPPDTGMAFVVIQHLSPPHKSLLPEIIQRYTAMQVVLVTNGLEIKPNHVYVIPPGNNLALVDGYLMLVKPNPETGLHLPIDFFFRSMAEVRGRDAIGIVLSGTARDGSLGIKNIKAEGGLTIAQDPATAEFGDMPRNAIATRDVDFIVPPEKMGELILKFVNNQPLKEYTSGEPESTIPLEGLQRLYQLLQMKSGHDFSLYKQSTLSRRIERRIKIKGVSNLESYIDYLQKNPEEVDELYREMLINVTHFFRDPKAFEALVVKAIQPILWATRTTKIPFRVWVAGCSSGEEAFSIAILIQEQIESLRIDCKVQIYATDLDEDAIASARKGFYLAGSSEHISAERLLRFFNKEEEGYMIKRSIRDMVGFSTQNVISDPPFSRIDLLCCRNLLIYMEPPLQNLLFPIFHYALNPGGFLFLGSSESISGYSDLFDVVDRKNKIYRRKEGLTPPRILSRVRPRFEPAALTSPDSKQYHPMKDELRERVDKALLQFHSPACVIIDEKNIIRYIHGRTGKYLELSQGESNANIIRMAREGLKVELAAAITTAITNHITVSKPGLRVKTDGDYELVDLTIRPIDWDNSRVGLLMVVFEEAAILPVESSMEPHQQKAKDSRSDDLEKALLEKDEYLNTIISELEDANQDLKSTNEEMQSTVEEMQSINEELETSKEELQSVNEELSTVNAELQNKNTELIALNNDVYNLLASTEIGTVFLDLDLQIRRFTPAIHRIYDLLPGDLGRPLRHFHSNLSYDHLTEDAQEVLYSLIPKVIEARTKEGEWYLINLKPYRTLENMVDGVVITFVDITKQKQGDDLRRLGTVTRDSNDAVTVQDFDGKIRTWNLGAAQMYGWTESKAREMNVRDMIPENLRKETMDQYQRVAKGEKINPFETSRVTRDGRILEVWVTLSVLVNEMGQPIGIATTERDITERNQKHQILRLENRSLQALKCWYQNFDDTVSSATQLKAVCQMLVEDAQYRLAWVGMAVAGRIDRITPLHWAGFGEDDALAQKILQTFTENNQKFVKSTLQKGKPATVRNIMADPAQAPLQPDALENEYNSFIVLPLVQEKVPMGILVLYAAEPDAFFEQESENLSLIAERLSQKMKAWHHDRNGRGY